MTEGVNIIIYVNLLHHYKELAIMIQRIQTIWLFLSGLVLLGLFVFPYVNYIDLVGLGKRIYVTGVYSYANNDVIRQESYLLQAILTVLLAIFPVYIIFKFKNRKLQIKLSYLQIVLVVLLAAWMYFSAGNVLSTNSQSLGADNIGIGFFLIPVSIILLAMAIGGIRKDEKLIKSANRLR